MPVQTVVRNVGFAIHEPLEEWSFRFVKHSIPFFEPVEFVGDGRPKIIRVIDALGVPGEVILHGRN
jgi:hypothetical protein